MDENQKLRHQLTSYLQGGQAYSPLAEVLAGITAAEAGKPVPGLPYTIWQQLGHLRITLYDILDFCRDPDYESPPWPEGYWPREPGPASQVELDKTIQQLSEGVEVMIRLVQDPARDLLAPFAYGEGQTLLREAMLVAEHNAYHLGQVVVLRRLLGTWKGS
jgi:hypothetical protein